MQKKLLLIALCFIWQIQGFDDKTIRARNAIRKMARDDFLTEVAKAFVWLSNKNNHTQPPPPEVLATLQQYGLASQSEVDKTTLEQADDIKFDPEQGWILMSFLCRNEK